VTRFLAAASDGDERASQELFAVVYAELHRLARAHFAHQRRDHTLQATALVHEAYVKLIGQSEIEWTGSRHFFLVASRAMRSILVDHERARRRLKRGGVGQGEGVDQGEAWRRVPVEIADETPAPSASVDVVALDEALDKLAALDERKARLVELRFFAGLTGEQAAEALGLSRSTVAEHWRMAKAWLRRELRD
jgi:RNA polymerase sigma-70 factor (ECF subfamily)